MDRAPNLWWGSGQIAHHGLSRDCCQTQVSSRPAAASLLLHVSQELGPKAHSESSRNAGHSGGQVATGLEQSAGFFQAPWEPSLTLGKTHLRGAALESDGWQWGSSFYKLPRRPRPTVLGRQNSLDSSTGTQSWVNRTEGAHIRSYTHGTELPKPTLYFRILYVTVPGEFTGCGRQGHVPGQTPGLQPSPGPAPAADPSPSAARGLCSLVSQCWSHRC